MEKYYTPDITDIRVGYECETYGRVNGKSNDEYHKIVVPDGAFVSKHVIDTCRLRTPFLTKEAIEEEGWERILKHDNMNFKKGNKILRIINYEGLPLKMLIEESMYAFPIQLFYGVCPSINELRQISKLLNIS